MELELGGQRLTLKWIHITSLLFTALLLSLAAAFVSFAWHGFYSFLVSNLWIVVISFYFLFAELLRRMGNRFDNRDYAALSVLVAASPALAKIALLTISFIVNSYSQGTEGAAIALISDILSIPVSAFVSFMAFRFAADFNASKGAAVAVPALTTYFASIAVIFAARTVLSGGAFLAFFSSMVAQCFSTLFYMLAFFSYVNAQKKFLELELWGSIALAFVIIKYVLGLLSFPLLVFYTAGAVGAYAIVHLRK